MNTEFRQGLLEAIRNQDRALIIELAIDAGRALVDARVDAANAKLDRELAVAQAYGEGRVVGPNKEARDACADGLVGAQSRKLVEADGYALLAATAVECVRYAKQLMVGYSYDD